MTNEEALNVARQSLAAFEFVPEAYDAAYTKACAAALEKQIPKKPHSITLGNVGLVELLPVGFCPNCRCGVQTGMNYCDYCGQRLDWERG